MTAHAETRNAAARHVAYVCKEKYIADVNPSQVRFATPAQARLHILVTAYAQGPRTGTGTRLRARSTHRGQDASQNQGGGILYGI